MVNIRATSWACAWRPCPAPVSWYVERASDHTRLATCDDHRDTVVAEMGVTVVARRIPSRDLPNTPPGFDGDR